MSKTKKATLIFTAIIILACIGLMGYKAIDPVYTLPEPWLGKGISRLNGTNPGGRLVWSPNGKYLAGVKSKFPLPDCPGPIIFCVFSKEPYSEIFIVDLSKMERKTVGRSKEFEKYSGPISWFPDGEHIAYIGRGTGSEWGIRSIDLNGKNDVQFISESGYPLWHPSISLIALQSTVDAPNSWFPVIYLLDLSTKKKELIFQGKDPGTSIQSLSWSADGKILAFTYGNLWGNGSIRTNVYFYYLETKKLVQFTDDKFEYWSAYFSPVNNIIVLERYTPNVTYYYQRNFIVRDLNNNCDEELPIRYVDSASWSPDGQQLLISAEEGVYIVDMAKYFGSKFTEIGSVCP